MTIRTRCLKKKKEYKIEKKIIIQGISGLASMVHGFRMAHCMIVYLDYQTLGLFTNISLILDVNFKAHYLHLIYIFKRQHAVIMIKYCLKVFS